MSIRLRRFVFLVFVLSTGCATHVERSGVAPRSLVVPAQTAVITAHPLATAAAWRMLDAGGAPIDAAIAAQMVLGLVEAQSSGVGGGSLLLNFDAGSKKLESFDGLAAAPTNVTAGLSVDTDGSPLKSETVQRGGRSVGVPGTLAVLKLVHARHGRLAWSALFAPAITLAEGGYPMAAYMHGIFSLPDAAANHPEMLPIWFTAEGRPKPIGSTITNPAYADSMRRIAADGPHGAWGKDGTDFLAAARRGSRPSLITAADLSNYTAQSRESVCAPFLAYSVCSMAPPSFGGVVVLQILQMLEARVVPDAPGRRFDFDDAEFVHYFAESGRLAQSDRLHYVGDPAFTPVPTTALVARDYVRERARSIASTRMTRDPAPGNVESKAAALEQATEAQRADATSQIAIVDKDGNALAMTTTNNLNFGSRLMVNGAVLNNAMTNFTAAPRPGQAAPNRMQGGKRPVTSMAPTIVFDRAGMPVAIGGSAGGGQIVDYVSQALVDMLANQRTPAEALARGHVSTAIRGKVQLEQGTSAAVHADALRAKGHDVEVVPMTSGLAFLLRRDGGWIGAADPRRDGEAVGR